MDTYMPIQNNIIHRINTETHNRHIEQQKDYTNTITLPNIKGITD